MTTFDAIYEHLNAPEGPDATGNYLAWCPFHPDGQGKPPHGKSLSVHPDRGFICRACDAKGSLSKLGKKLGIEVDRTDGEWDAQYDYVDEHGALLFQVVRRDHSDGKTIRQRRPDGNGGHAWNTRGCPRVLYRFQELLASDPDATVFLVEGEKNVEDLRSLGLTSTTNPGGAGKWPKLDSEGVAKALAGRSVVVLPDNDEPGRRHAEEVMKGLLGIASEIRRLDLPDLQRGGDVSDWLASGGTRKELERLAAEEPVTPKDLTEEEPFEILDNAPSLIDRPLSLAAGRGYAATWVYGREGGRVLVLVRDDGVVFCDKPVHGAEPLQKIGLVVHLSEPVEDGRCWSGAGLKRFMNGARPDPAEVLGKVADVVDALMDFDRSLASQRSMCEFVACYVLTTYLLPAFSVVGYLWPNGEKGSGKTRLLEVVAEMAYLGHVVLNSSSVATLRDLAHYGATLAFDDAESIMDVRRADPDKRALFLAGNRRGSTITVKEPVGKKWVTRFVKTFCPRLFSAIRLPDDVLGSRTISIPLIRSCDKAKTDPNPLDDSAWPHNRRVLVDDLWSVAVTHVARLPRFDSLAASKSSLSGRNLEPWRAVLAVALWLESEHGIVGLFDRIEALAKAYQVERSTLEKTDLTRLAILALRKMACEQHADTWEFRTRELADQIDQEARLLELLPDKEHGGCDGSVGSSGRTEGGYASVVKVGKLLERLRFERPSERSAKGRRWRTSRAHINKLCRSYGMAPLTDLPPQPVTPATPVTPVTGAGDASVSGVTGVAGVTGTPEATASQDRRGDASEWEVVA